MTLSRLTGIVAAGAVFVLVVLFAAVVFVMTSDVFKGNAFPVDFAAFWGAARLGLEGRAMAAFDEAAIAETVVFPPEYPQQRFPWMYPPTWAMVVTPLGALPFWAAWVLFSLGSILLYALAVRRWSGELPGHLNLVVAAPVVLIGAFNGNTGILIAGLLVLALSAIETGRPVMAGLMIAAMTVKPTMGLMIPFALASGGHWRVILWASVGAVVFAAAAVIPFGIEYWARFFAGILTAADKLATGEISYAVMVTWYAFARSVGLLHEQAIVVQAAVSVLMIGVMAWAWRRDVGLGEKGALLLIATPLATPYAHYYEMAFTLAGMVLWVHAGHGKRRDEQVLMALLWLAPVLVVLVRDPPLVALLGAPLASAMLVLMAARSRA